MKKTILSTFINKYSLNSSIETTKWIVNEETNTIQVYTTTDDKSTICLVDMKFTDNLTSGELGIYDTAKLLKMISVMDDDIYLSFTYHNDRIISLNLASESTEIEYVTCDLSVVPKSHKLVKDFEYDVEIPIDKQFITNFIKSKNALSDVDNFAVVPVSKSKSENVQIVIGYHKTINTTRIHMDVTPTDSSKKLSRVINFNAKHLKEIFSSNKEFDTAVLKICAGGLMYVEFVNDLFSCKYYLVEVTSI